MSRTWTPDRRNPDGSTTLTVKVVCPTCGRTLGDASEIEMTNVIAGRLPEGLAEECGCTRSDDGREVPAGG